MLLEDAPHSLSGLVLSLGTPCRKIPRPNQNDNLFRKPRLAMQPEVWLVMVHGQYLLVAIVSNRVGPFFVAREVIYATATLEQELYFPVHLNNSLRS